MGQDRESAEVVIVGAGPAGSALAVHLAGRGRDVLLLDRAVFPRDKTCGDGLTPRAISPLARLGVLADLQARGYRRVRGARLAAPNGHGWDMRFADHDLAEIAADAIHAALVAGDTTVRGLRPYERMLRVRYAGFFAGCGYCCAWRPARARSTF